MKVYTADKDSGHIKTVRLWGFNVSKRCTKAAVWLGTWGREGEVGLGFVEVLNLLGPITNLKTRRLYGLVWIKFKEATQ